MLEVLQFIFSSFWIWLGTLILITAPISSVKEIFKQVRKSVRHKKEYK